MSCIYCETPCVCVYIYIYIYTHTHTHRGCLNMHGTHMTANNSTNNNVVFFACFRFKNSIQSSSSSYRAGSTDIPDPLSPLLPIVHRPW